jgi:hypothetical protein
MSKGLTPEKIKAKIKDGRGQGIGADYKPFINVNEISSRGRSHRVPSQKHTRIHHLLSDLELMVFLALDWDRKVIDIREQFPLVLDETLFIATEAGISHPKVGKNNQVMTTDFLVDYDLGPYLTPFSYFRHTVNHNLLI